MLKRTVIFLTLINLFTCLVVPARASVRAGLSRRLLLFKTQALHQPVLSAITPFAPHTASLERRMVEHTANSGSEFDEVEKSKFREALRSLAQTATYPPFARAVAKAEKSTFFRIFVFTDSERLTLPNPHPWHADVKTQTIAFLDQMTTMPVIQFRVFCEYLMDLGKLSLEFKMRKISKKVITEQKARIVAKLNGEKFIIPIEGKALEYLLKPEVLDSLVPREHYLLRAVTDTLFELRDAVISMKLHDLNLPAQPPATLGRAA